MGRAVRLVALALAACALLVPWFNAEGSPVPVYRIPLPFTVTYYAGLAVTLASLVRDEPMALLAAATLVSTSPAYAYYALLMLARRVSVSAGPLLCAAAAALLALEWVRATRPGRSL